MRDLSALELAAVAGGFDGPVVVITEDRWTDEQKAEYDLEQQKQGELIMGCADQSPQCALYLIGYIWNMLF